MLGLYVSVPIACFRKGLAREYLETEPLPPPSTCYGFLLAFIGETDRRRHIGCRVTASLIGEPPTSVVLRTVWRVKKAPLGSSGNTRPDYQQLLTEIDLIIWVDSSDETRSSADPTLEDRIRTALANPSSIERFGGLSLGESTHLVNDVLSLERMPSHLRERPCQTFLVAKRGRITLPVWVDHVGTAKTCHTTGNLVEGRSGVQPDRDVIPMIQPPGKT